MSNKGAEFLCSAGTVQCWVSRTHDAHPWVTRPSLFRSPWKGFLRKGEAAAALIYARSWAQQVLKMNSSILQQHPVTSMLNVLRHCLPIILILKISKWIDSIVILRNLCCFQGVRKAGLIPNSLHGPSLGDLAQNIHGSCHPSTTALSLTSSTLHWHHNTSIAHQTARAGETTVSGKSQAETTTWAFIFFPLTFVIPQYQSH